MTPTGIFNDNNLNYIYLKTRLNYRLRINPVCCLHPNTQRPQGNLWACLRKYLWAPFTMKGGEGIVNSRGWESLGWNNTEVKNETELIELSLWSCRVKV